MEENLNAMKVAAYRNAIRLFRDACIIAVSGSSETAFAIAILAYEEIGKVALADRQLDRICLNPGSETVAGADFSELSRKHRTKQGWAAFDSGSESPEKFANLDLEKQSAIYTDLTTNGIHVPSVSEQKLHDMLHEVYRAMQGIHDLAYNGVYGTSSSKSEWMASADIASVKEVYEKATGL